MPRFTLLQLLGLMTVCGVLFCIAAIDPVASAVVLGVIVWCGLMGLLVCGITYLVTRLIAELTYLVVGRPTAASPFSAAASVVPQRPVEAKPDLAATVESLQADSQQVDMQQANVEPKSGEQPVDPTQPPESPFA